MTSQSTAQGCGTTSTNKKNRDGKRMRAGMSGIRKVPADGVENGNLAGSDQAGSAQRVSMTMIQAIRSAMDVMLERDENVVVFGQDVGYFGGVFRCTEGLQAKYGKTRVFDAPISEGGIVGAAVGMG
ncbi:MAG TPA: hypothetical protein VK062_00945, partial [Burkholderiaceae bacterium]|nr:hypothetical protein [Burkholderiaceae bacterium]